ncbi:hypothetical protein K3495_g6355 [Podosphaera aphanis]|nr:hypothetical protein K3495_g6355 [Podosphaera aphanis]
MDKILSHVQSTSTWMNMTRQDLQKLFMYTHIIISALFPIFIGAHASLRCPPSARPSRKRRASDTDDVDELDHVVDDVVQGLQPSDAIVFPVLAGMTLGGLYLLIKWLDDPALLNRIFNWYFSSIGIFGVAKMAVDALNVLTTFLFPKVWSTSTDVFVLDPVLAALSVDSGARSRPIDPAKTNPFPGLLSTIPFPTLIMTQLWSLRALLSDHLIFRGYIKSLLHVVSPVRLNDVTGFILGVFTIILYNLYERAWWLTNLIAFGFCYGALQLISPTNFWTGSLVLFGLFIYDIAMVFYTPLMTTVATTLDVPIKLVFPGPQRGSMLGLGDVVIPGMMIALALRFDLYLHYFYKQSSSANADKKEIIKVDYVEATGLWGERFWTTISEIGSKPPTIADGARFKKVYFWASVIGYIVGMIVTFLVLNIFSHAQPALFYLVPSVLSSLWITAWVRNEIGLMWEYTEDGEWGFQPEEKSHVCQDNVSKVKEDGMNVEKAVNGNRVEIKSDNAASSSRDPQKRSRDREAHTRHLFLFSLTVPRKRSKIAKLTEKDT